MTIDELKRLQEIKARMAAATPGDFDWVASNDVSKNGGFHLYLVDSTGRKIAALWGKSVEKVANANLLGAAKSDLAWLIERLEKAP